jgi:hypothetical protein
MFDYISMKLKYFYSKVLNATFFYGMQFYGFYMRDPFSGRAGETVKAFFSAMRLKCPI